MTKDPQPYLLFYIMTSLSAVEGFKKFASCLSRSRADKGDFEPSQPRPSKSPC